jgi:5-methylcytosine-specific restriction protein A
MLEEAIDRTKVVFVDLGSGAWVKEYKWGHEDFNFEKNDGKYYGYAPPLGKINLKRISSDIQLDSDRRQYIDNVLVIFSTGGTGGRIISGYYQNARVYAEPIENKMENRKHDDEYISYNLVCSVKNGCKLREEERKYKLPYAKTSPSGYGHHQLWYADQSKDKGEREKAIDYVIDYIYGKYYDETNDEHKYDESKITPKTVYATTRSQKARQECINFHGTVCKICGFDFEKIYGEIGKEFIEVHHIESITTLSRHDEYAGTNPIKDLIPVCSNCHSMLHRKRPAYLPEVIKNNITKKS